MKKTLIIFSIIILSCSLAQAQYPMSIGVRFGKLNNGITFKTIFNTDQSIGMEVQLYSSLIAAQYGYTTKGFLLKQVPFKVPIVQLPLDFIIGGGLQVGYFPYDAPGYYNVVDGQPQYYGTSVVTVGVAANIALEYKLPKRIPFTIGVDLVPSYDFVHPGPDWFDFGVDVRYVIR